MLTLNEFISSALLDVARGIKSANDTLMAERGRKRGQESVFFVLGPVTHRASQSSVAFDLAVTTTETKGKKGRAALAIKVVEAGLEKGSEVKEERISRIQFTVNMATNLA